MSHRFIRAVFMQRWTDPWSSSSEQQSTGWTWDQWALDTVIGLLPGLLKQSTPASIPLVLKKDIMKRIKNNDLTHYFLSDHRQLPASYLASCRKFFKSLKPQAPSSPGHKLQASSLTAAGPCVISRIIKDKL